MDTNLILAISQVVAVAIIPIAVWLMGIFWQNRKAKDDAKRNLFFALMANRKATPNKEWVDALNIIDVVFQDDHKVRAAWRAYYDSLDSASQYNKNTNAFLLDLLSEMANSLGYKNLKQTEIDRAYTPQGFIDSSNLQLVLQKEALRVLLHSKNNAEGFSDEEYEKHYAELSQQ